MREGKHRPLSLVVHRRTFSCWPSNRATASEEEGCTLLDFDLTELLRDSLASSRRAPDAKLHPSGDLCGSLRHSQLRAAGAPTIESETTSDVRLMTGTMWHSYFEAAFQRSRRPVMTEVKLDRWLPEGWSGTADWLIWNDELKAFVLGDLKTIKGEGMAYVARDGIKTEHVWQASAYWYACEAMGIPLVKGFVVYYLPQNVPVDRPDVQPQVLEGMPLDRDLVVGRMEERWQATETYLAQVRAAQERSMYQSPSQGRLSWVHFLQPALAPVQERIQQVRWNGKQDCWDLKLVPHWSAAYCPYPPELCNCREQGQTKIGSYRIEFGDGTASLEYEPRKFKEGEAPAEDVTPTTGPTQVEFGRKLKEKENG